MMIINYKGFKIHYTTTDCLKEIPLALLFQLLNEKSTSNNIRNLQIEALDKLIRRLSKITFEQNPPEAKSKLAIVGDTTFKKRALRKRLGILDIELQNNIDSNTTHVLIGKKLGFISKELQGKTLLKDTDLQYFLEQREAPFLLQETDNSKSTLHIADLLFSKNKENYNIGLSIIKGGGLTTALIPYVFVVIKTTKNAKLRKELKSLLKLKLSPEGLKSLNKTFSFKEDLDESKIQKNIKKYTDNVSDLDGLIIAQVLYQYKKQGFSYIWKYSKDKEQIKQTIKDHIVDNKLNFFDRGIKFLPNELAEFPQIEIVELGGNQDLSKVPSVLAKLPYLHTLDISFTDIQEYTLKSPLFKIKKLKHLILNGVPIFLDKIKELNHLEHLTLNYNAYLIDEADQYIIPNQQESTIKKVLPNCTITWT